MNHIWYVTFGQVNRLSWSEFGSDLIGWFKTLRGGYFVAGVTRTLDLDALFRPFIELFNAYSKSVYKSSGWICLDEILSKKSFKKVFDSRWNRIQRRDSKIMKPVIFTKIDTRGSFTEPRSSIWCSNNRWCHVRRLNYW